MSGTEAFALATGVMTVINFTADTAKVFKALYEGRPTANDELQQRTKSMRNAMTHMQNMRGTLQPQSIVEQNLVDLAQKCDEAAGELLIQLAKIQPQQGNKDHIKNVVAAVKSTVGKSKIEQLEKSLDQYRQTLDSTILVQLHERTAIAHELPGDFKAFNSRYIADRAEESSRIHKIFTQSQREKLQKSLKFAGMNERRNHIKESHGETYQWIFSSKIKCDTAECSELIGQTMATQCSSFTAWLRSESQARFWISGKPGSGKSTLVKYILENKELRESLRLWHPAVTVLSHYFWKPGGGLQCSIKGLWCSLGHQLFRDASVADFILDQFPSAADHCEPSDWSLPDLERVVLQAFRMQVSASCIFIDGLDEVVDSDAIPDLRRAIDSISASSNSNIKICLASRPEIQLTPWLQDLPMLKLHHLTHDDMVMFAKNKLQKCLAATNAYDDLPGLIARAERELVRKADGVFIWLVLAVRSVIRGLEAGDSENIISGRIKQLPGDIDMLYADMWSRLDSVYQDQAAMFMRYAIATEVFERLNLVIHYTVLASTGDIHQGPNLALCGKDLNMDAFEQKGRKTRLDLELRCAGFFEVKAKQKDQNVLMNKVDFIHRTAYDYLTTTSMGLQLLSRGESSCNDRFMQAICTVCTVHFGPFADAIYGRFTRGPGAPLCTQDVEALFFSCAEKLGKVNVLHVLKFFVSYQLETAVAWKTPQRLIWSRPELTTCILAYWLTEHLSPIIDYPSSDPDFDSIIIQGLNLDHPRLATAVLRQSLFRANHGTTVEIELVNPPPQAGTMLSLIGPVLWLRPHHFFIYECIWNPAEALFRHFSFSRDDPSQRAGN